MLQLNDSGNTLIDLTTNNLRGISYSGSYDLTIKLKIKDVVLETEFEYEFLQKCVQIQLKKATADDRFLKDIQKIRKLLMDRNGEL